MASGGKRATREEGMRAVLEKWERSGLPLSRLADREGIAHKTMYRWRERLRIGNDRVRRGRPAGACVGDGDRDPSPPAAPFLVVSAALRRASSAVAVMFEVVLGSGTTVRVPEHFEAGALRRLLETLRAC